MQKIWYIYSMCKICIVFGGITWIKWFNIVKTLELSADFDTFMTDVVTLLS